MPPTPDFSATNPWVTAVGGTTTGIDQNGNVVLGHRLGDRQEHARAPQEVEARAHRATTSTAPGGGTSRLYAEPCYQRGVVPDSLSTQNQTGPGAKGRVVPDISMDGDPNTGMLIGETQTFPDGCTTTSTASAAPACRRRCSPASWPWPTTWWVSTTASSTRRCTPTIAGTPGINDVLPLTGQGDVRVDYVNGVDASNGLMRSLRSFDDTAGLAIHTTAGYDNTTGLGTPNGLQFLLRLH